MPCDIADHTSELKLSPAISGVVSEVSITVTDCLAATVFQDESVLPIIDKAMENNHPQKKLY